MSSLLQQEETALLDRLEFGRIHERISSRVVGRELRIHDSVSSTNRLAAEMARGGAREGAVVIADAQSDGRGREGKRWFSPPGVNLHLSTIFRPDISVESAAVVSFLGSIAMVDAVRSAGVESVGIRWPNDLVSGERKLGGMLVDLGITGHHVDFLVVGVGLNVNVDRAALERGLGVEASRATSLLEVAGRRVDRNDLAARAIDFLDLWLHLYRERGPKVLLDGWSERDALGRQMIEVIGGDAPVRGWIVGLDNLGRLVIEDRAGGWHPVTAGKIQLAG